MKLQLGVFFSILVVILGSCSGGEILSPNRFDVNVKYYFDVKIISGSKTGQVFTGSFSFPKKEINSRETKIVRVDEFEFDFDYKYNHLVFDLFSVDTIPEVLLVEGQLKDLYFSGGPDTLRFGLNKGYDRKQFNRNSEAFVANGESYFGYSNHYKFVEGAGQISYRSANNSHYPTTSNARFKYDFKYTIISGTLKDSVYKGSFTYLNQGISGKGEEFVWVDSVQFEYDKIIYTQNNLDNTAQVRLLNGYLKDLILVGGAQTKRFGFNAGFERSQFNRKEERFILNNESYFGYMTQKSYIDGAAKIRYHLRPF